ncbi:hypothetical protein ACMYR3_10215 [Ampullimonas aquatilis]|uniref:hypothetical protein n=1 Tax=Ampullimonas aquatilis TaxID=1341549 RepID=UPI003C70E5EB
MKWVKNRVVQGVALAMGIGLISTEASALILSNNGTDTEVTLFVWDYNKNIGYIRDLGLDWGITGTGASKPTARTVFSQNFSSAGDANYTNFLSQIGGASSSTLWGVYSGQSAAGQSQLLSTFHTGLTPTYTNLSSYQNGNSAGSAWQDVIHQANNGVVSGNATTTMGFTGDINGSIITTQADGSGNPTTEGWSLGYNLAVNTTNAFAGSKYGMSSAFYIFENNVTSSTRVNPSQLAGTWTLNAATGQLDYTVAAVPTPTTSLLMLSGLVVLGSIKKRRQGKLSDTFRSGSFAI